MFRYYLYRYLKVRFNEMSLSGTRLRFTSISAICNDIHIILIAAATLFFSLMVVNYCFIRI